MERINQYAFYDLGQALRALSRFQGDTHPTHIVFPAHIAKERLEGLLAGTPILLGVSLSRCVKLKDALRVLIRPIFAEDGSFDFPEPTAALIPGYLFDMYRNALDEFETVFQDEMRETPTYYVPSRGIYHIPSLVDNADAAFPSEVAMFLPQKAKDDWRAAGRCLAFNLPSASGFHVARAVEGALEAFYKCYLGRDPVAGRSWGDMIADLEKVAQNPVPTKKTLSSLRQMKDDYRNPLVHPRVTLDAVDALVLFTLGQCVLVSMAQEMKAVADGGVQPCLTLVE